MKYLKIYMSLLILLFISSNSCRKVGVVSQFIGQPITGQNMSAIRAWLSSQRASSSLSDQVQIDSIESALNFSLAEASNFNKFELLITIPINLTTIKSKKKYKSLMPVTASTINELALIIDRFGKIRLGNIVQLTSSNRQIEKRAIAELIKNIYNNKNVNYSGTFTVLTIRENPVFELTYKNNRISSFASTHKYSNLNALLKSEKGGLVSEVVLKRSANSIIPKSYKTLTDETGQCYYDYWVTYLYDTVTGAVLAILDVEFIGTEGDCGGESSINPENDPGGGNTTPVKDSTELATVQAVNDSLTNPCMDSAFKAVTNGMIKNYITNLYKDTYVGYGKTITLNISEVSGPIYNGANNSVPAESNGDTTNNSWTIHLSDYFANNNNMSQEAWGMAIIHEILHSFIAENQTIIDAGLANNAHSIIFDKFVVRTYDLLIQAFSMDSADAKKLCLAGLNDLFDSSNSECAANIAYADSVYGATPSQVDSVWSLYTSSKGTKCGH